MCLLGYAPILFMYWIANWLCDPISENWQLTYAI